MSKRVRHTIILSFFVILTMFLLVGCRTTGTYRIVKGSRNSSIQISWFAEHKRPLFNNQYDDDWSRVSVAVDEDRNVYLLDRLTGYGNRRGWWLRRFTPDASIVWTKKQAPNPGQKLLSQKVAVDPKGDIVVLAVARQKHPGVYLQKYSPNGRLIWRQSRPALPNLNGGRHFLLVFDPKGNIYVGGVLVRDGFRQPWAAKYLPDGELDWEKWLPRRGYSSELPFMDFSNEMLHVYSDRSLYYGADGRKLSDSEIRQRLKKDNIFWRTEPPYDEENEESVLYAIGPRSFQYTILNDRPEPLSVWLQVSRGGADPVFLRMLITHAPEKPGAQYIQPQQLIVDNAGNAYIVVLEKKRKSNLTKLYKVKVTLPQVSRRLKNAAKKLTKPPAPITPVVKTALKKVTETELKNYLTELLPKARLMDEENQKIVRGATKFANGRDGRALSVLKKGKRPNFAWGISWMFIEPANIPPSARHLQDLLRDAARSRQSCENFLIGGIEALDIRQIKQASRQLKQTQQFTAKARRELKRLSNNKRIIK